MSQFAFRPEAREELRDAIRYYEKEEAGLGGEFLSEVRAAVELVLANPGAAPAFEAGTRRKLLARFPYSIIYLHESGRTEIIAIVHHRREPGYWTERV